MEKLISVIIPVYNREKLIGECLRSVLGQSHRNLQVILIDDGSTDGTLEVCKEFAAADSRVVLLQPGHRGVSGARNAGLDAATGEYVFFVDSDDVLHPRALAPLVRGMEESGAGLGGIPLRSVPQARWERIYPHMETQTGEGETEYLTHRETVHAIFRQITPINIIAGVIMRRELIGDTRFDPELFIGEDFWFIYQNLIKGASAAFLKQRWYYYRHHDTNISNNYTYAGFLTRFRRRELVWRSEEALGRHDNAALQKRDAFDVYLRCIRENTPKEDLKKIIATVKRCRRELLSGTDFSQRVKFFLYVNFPFLYRLRLKFSSK